MIKKTLHFSNPAYLSLKNNQLVVKFIKDDTLPERGVPIEDIGLAIFDHPQITITHSAVNALIDNNAAILWCNEQHLPNAWVLPTSSNQTFTEKLRYQLEATEPLKKQLWKQNVSAKIRNQAAVLSLINKDYKKLLNMIGKIGSGDPSNIEGRASYHYWQNIFDDFGPFNRNREGAPPNNLLNYGYAILRSILARAIAGSGMLPAMGIHHRNKYNAFCLADDLMEAYRPYVDLAVLGIMQNENGEIPEKLNKDLIIPLLKIPDIDVVIDGNKSPLFVGVQRTTASLMQCFEGKKRKLSLPEIPAEF